MFARVLKRKFKPNNPIFTQEILETFKEFSRPRVFQLLNKAIDNGSLIKYDLGVYYVPIRNELGLSSISFDQVIEKKYLRNKSKVYGIYGRKHIKQNFGLINEEITILEIITNNEESKRREVTIKNRKVILHKSRCKINKSNVHTYILLELLTDFDIKRYNNDLDFRNKVLNYIKENKISKNKITLLIKYFPKKTLINYEESGLIDL